jgi:hypothetical protein
MTTRGHCLCGHIAYEFEGEPNWIAHCHCESCRRATSSPFTTFFGVSEGRWRWTGGQPATFASSPGVIRSFCPRCGSPMAYKTERRAETDFYAASLDDHSGLRPGVHVHWAEHVGWVEPADSLPRK